MVLRRATHSLYYVIEFKEPVDYFDVLLQKQIDLRLKFEPNVNYILISKIHTDSHTMKPFYEQVEKIFESNPKELQNIYQSYECGGINFLELLNDPDKSNKFKKILDTIIKKKFNPFNDSNKSDFDPKDFIQYEEFEYKFDLVLEELKIFVNTLKLEPNQTKLLESFSLDPKIIPNIKFIGWKDY